MYFCSFIHFSCDLYVSMKPRSKLPFRETCDCFLLHNGKVVALNKGSYMAFPGGGIEKGESIIQAAKREIKEETGAVLKPGLIHMCTVDWVWFPEWAKNDKQKARYKKYQGERIHILVGEVKSFGTPSSTEGDAWSGKMTQGISPVIASLEKQKDHPNMDTYKAFQLCALKALLFKTKST